MRPAIVNILILVIFICCSCGGTRYVSQSGTDYKSDLPKLGLTIAVVPYSYSMMAFRYPNDRWTNSIIGECEKEIKRLGFNVIPRQNFVNLLNTNDMDLIINSNKLNLSLFENEERIISLCTELGADYLVLIRTNEWIDNNWFGPNVIDITISIFNANSGNTIHVINVKRNHNITFDYKRKILSKIYREIFKNILLQ